VLTVEGSAIASSTPNLWRCFCFALEAGKFRCDDGILADVAPTILFLLGMKQPVEMTGRNLLVPASEKNLNS